MFSSCRTQPTQYCDVMISRGWSERLAPPRCQSVPLVIASDPDGIVILIASARSPVSRLAVRLLKSAGFTAPAMISLSQRWLVGIISVAPFNSVVSSIAQNVLTPSGGRGLGIFALL